MGEVRQIITSRLTAKEKESLKKRACRLGMSESGYIRECIRYGIPGEDNAYSEKDRMMTLREFAERIHVSVAKARSLCIEGVISYYIVCGDFRLKVEDVDCYLEKSKKEMKEKEEWLKPLFTIPEVASKYNVTPQTVDNWVRKGKMPACRIDGRHLRIKQEDVDCMMEEYRLKV